MKTSQLDFRELLSFNPQGGVIRFLGQRVYLMDAAAQSLLRKEMIETLGREMARRLLTRSAYAQGWRIAETVKKKLPDVWAEAKEGKLGPMLCALCGYGDMIESSRTDGHGQEPLVESIMRNSFEAEQHLMLFGSSHEAVCWRFAAFASGYVSYLEGREVYFIEDQCQAKGDDCCRIRGKYREMWGAEIDPYLPYYHIEDVETMCAELSRKLRATEKSLLEYRQHLPFIQDSDGVGTYQVSRSSAMQKVIDFALRVAEVDSSVMITGESGVGKERMAYLIHERSARSSKPFLAVNCGAMTETLLDSELFGHVKGAFTGADRERIGLFEEATGGTLFLDEIGEISPAMQVRLLRALQEKEVRRVGDNTVRQINVRVICATNRNLQEDVASGRFRQDLYYRLKVIELPIPPLRDRHEDILPLARFFLQALSQSMGKKITGFSPKAADHLLYYEWPGNIRELQNTIEYAVVLCRTNQIDADDLPPELRTALFRPSVAADIRPLASIEREYIWSVYQALGNNKARTAEKLEMSLATLYRKLKECTDAGFGS